MSISIKSIPIQATPQKKSLALDANDWKALDDIKEWSRFSQSIDKENARWESHIVIEGMHCAACAFKVENALKPLSGVDEVSVNATSGHAKVIWQSNLITPSLWVTSIYKAGYQAFPASDLLHQDERKKTQRQALWKLLVAGFCMMQVMMFSVPTYMAIPGEMTSNMKSLMEWASWVITLPVILFSCGPFFKSALNDLKTKKISMDMPVSLGILIMFIVSTAATFDPNGLLGKEVYFDSLTMFVFFLLIGRWIELKMRDKTAGALDVLMRRMPRMVNRLNANGMIEKISVSLIQIGDVLEVKPGEAFPADGKIIFGSTHADEALLTGESAAIIKSVHAKVIAGSFNLTNSIHMQVELLGQETRYAKIVRLMEKASTDKPRLALMADRIAKYFLLVVMLLAFGVGIYFWQFDHAKAILAVVAVLIVTCPCALSLATPAAMLSMSGFLAKQGVLVQKMQALEALTQVNTVVFDKTGTLTSDQIFIDKIFTDNSMTEKEVMAIAASLSSSSLHPVSKTFVHASEPNHTLKIEKIEEVSGGGLLASTSLGDFKLGSLTFCGLVGDEFNHLKEEQLQVHLMRNNNWVASFMMTELIKEDALLSIQALRHQSLNIEILSGDKLSSVKRVADQLSIQNIKGQCSPEDKLKHIQLLESQYSKVLMVGDGLNDGPVLAFAHASIALGQGAPLSQAKSDFIILKGELYLIPKLIAQAKRTMKIVKQNLLWAALYNLICIPLAVMGFLPAWLAGLGMALSSLFVILNASRLAF
ncbi:MAG: cation-translocating P-type ATPase [Limnohabitans sp.]|nr:cation-translocating P-type ATPase [Limnohabitans sp.]